MLPWASGGPGLYDAKRWLSIPSSTISLHGRKTSTVAPAFLDRRACGVATEVMDIDVGILPPKMGCIDCAKRAFAGGSQIGGSQTLGKELSMTQVRGRNAKGTGTDPGPLGTLAQLVEQARKVEPVDGAFGAGDDPLGSLEALVERARREQEGEGGEALRQLKQTIAQSHELPPATAYEPRRGDPLEVLRARMRGELDEQKVAQSESSGADESLQVSEQAPGQRADFGDVPAQQRMGAALEASLRKRELPGDVRADVALRLAQLMERVDDEGLEEIWELIVFGR